MSDTVASTSVSIIITNLFRDREQIVPMGQPPAVYGISECEAWSRTQLVCKMKNVITTPWERENS